MTEKTEYQGMVHFKESRKVSVETSKGNWSTREAEMSLSRRYDDTDEEIPTLDQLKNIVQKDLKKWEDETKIELKFGASSGSTPKYPQKTEKQTSFASGYSPRRRR